MASIARMHVVWNFVLLCVIVLVLAAMPAVPSARAETGAGQCFESSQANGKTVALDPGHGSDGDTGTSNKTYNLVEKDVVLDIAVRTKDILIGKGYKVCLTRTGDTTGLGNTARAEFANANGAHVFVSIHLNGSTDKSVNYTSTFWGKKIKDEKFSRHMFGVLKPGLGLDGGFVSQFASGALLKSNMPATLTESVFLTNDAEAELLVDEDNDSRRQTIAQLHADGIDEWLKNSDSSSGGGGKGKPAR